MLFKTSILEGIASGSVTAAFRRWKRLRVRPGSRITTAVGIIEITSVERVDMADITQQDAVQAGYTVLGELLRDLDAFSREGDLYRLGLERVADDPRIALRERGAMDAQELEELAHRLSRFDRASPSGPWTADFLGLISRRPGAKAGDLAKEIGWEKEKLKIYVRKLKNLGLTISLGTGYRLSPRGEACLSRLNSVKKG